MKKTAIFALLLAMLLTLTACGPSSFQEADPGKYIVLGEYKGLSYPKKELKVTDFSIQTEINSAMTKLGYGKEIPKTIKEGTIEINDIVNIDYSGTKDGIAFSGGTAKEQSLTIGSGQFVPGFEEQLVGVKVGETVNIELTFPLNYSSELRGQDVVFEVTVNSITGKMTYPELTDDIVNEIDEEVKTADELRQKIKIDLEAANALEVQGVVEFQLWNRVLESSSVKKEIPSKLTAIYEKQFDAYHKTQATQYGLKSIKEYLKANNVSEDVYNSIKKESAMAQAKEMMIAYAIAKAENYIVTDEVYNDSIEKYAAEAGYSESNYVSAVGENNIKNQIVLDYAVDLVLENAKEK